MASSITSRLGTTPNEAVKAPVVAATTTNITLAGEQTIDGVAVVAGDRVLVKDQTAGAENGIYNATTGAWSRATDWDASGDVAKGVMMLDTNGQVFYQASFSGAFTLGSTAVTFTAIPYQNSSAVVYTPTGGAATTVEAALNANRVQTYTTLAAAIADGANIVAGDIIRTRGRTSVNDGGEAFYLVQTSGDFGGTPDETNDHTLSSGDIAVLQEGIRNIARGSNGHSDGANTLTGSQRFFIGNNTESSDDSALLIGRGLTGSYNTGAHAVRDESTVAYTGAGFYGYASFDAIAVASGSTQWNHINGYQARQTYSGSNTIDGMSSFQSNPGVSSGGTADLLYHFHVKDPGGTGTINQNVGLYVEPMTRGTANYAIYSGSASLPSYHGGKWQMGTAPQVDVAGFKSAFGQIPSFDTSGNMLSNPNLTIVNGTLTMSAAAAVIEATVSFTLKLDAVGIVDSLKPHRFPVYTVATLPSAASYTYCRVFVSDSNATTTAGIGATVAGGGSNKVPVYSDGTNWIIG